jgi:hypothetical protein
LFQPSATLPPILCTSIHLRHHLRPTNFVNNRDAAVEQMSDKKTPVSSMIPYRVSEQTLKDFMDKEFPGPGEWKIVVSAWRDRPPLPKTLP